MAGIEEYRRILVRILEEYAALKPSLGDIEVESVFDEVRDHYEITYAGWVKEERIHGPVVHVDIRGGKFWIQHDGTESGIATELMEAGVPQGDIVLAFLSPSERKHLKFALS